jgi:hypothetical protein
MTPKILHAVGIIANTANMIQLGVAGALGAHSTVTVIVGAVCAAIATIAHSLGVATAGPEK